MPSGTLLDVIIGQSVKVEKASDTKQKFMHPTPRTHTHHYQFTCPSTMTTTSLALHDNKSTSLSGHLDPRLLGIVPHFPLASPVNYTVYTLSNSVNMITVLFWSICSSCTNQPS